jgi:hypothetical protein
MFCSTRAHFLALCLIVAGAASANATVIVGGRTYADSAFADSLDVVSVTGDGSLRVFNAPDAESAVIGSDFNSNVSCGDGDFGTGTVCILDISFLDNRIINGSGVDFTVFELGGAQEFDITVNGVTISFPESAAIEGLDHNGTDPINAFDVDLIDFGIATDATIGSLRLTLTDWDEWDSADPAAIGAINNLDIPEPATTGLLLAGLAGVAVLQRRR